MTSLMEEDTENDTFEEDPRELYGVRDGTLFLVDATPPMFKSSDEGDSYFLQCIKHYKEILKLKLGWHRQDWMGLILFGTEKWDMDPEVKNILTLQKLNVPSRKDLIEIMNIEKREWKHYRDIASSTAYPLHDALWHAAQAFSSVKITMPKKRVILFTCQDTPPLTDNNEKHRIRLKSTSYNDIGIQLIVFGLGENWNQTHFYKDLEMAANKIKDEDYKKLSHEELVKQVKLPSRNMAKLPFRLGENVTLDVSVCNLCVKTQYLKKELISKATNVPVNTHTYWEKSDASSDEEGQEDEESQRPMSPVLETEIQKYQEFGDRRICFTQAEVMSLSTIREPGIDLICVKPIDYHPLYHLHAPFFVTYNKSYRKDNKLLFGALLDKCMSRGLMVICAVTLRKRSAPNLYSMIPDAENGGFYLYQIPFRDNVRDLSKDLAQYIYNDDNKPPTDPEGIELLAKIVKKLRIKYTPELFPNPKLKVQLQTVETLALDLEEGDPPFDDTRKKLNTQLREKDLTEKIDRSVTLNFISVPSIEDMREAVGDLLNEYDNIFNDEGDCESDTSSKKKHARTNGTPMDATALEDENTIRELVNQEKLGNCTVAQLRNILKNVGLKTSGKKEELIQKVTEHYGGKS